MPVGMFRSEEGWVQVDYGTGGSIRGALQGVDRRRLYRGGPYRVGRGGLETHV
jgi:hypothetical protein